MRSYSFLALSMLAALACSGGDSLSTEVKPEFAPMCVPPKPKIVASPTAVTKPRHTTGHRANFTVSNPCSVGLAVEFSSSRTGSVASVSAPSRPSAVLAVGASTSVTVNYSTGAPGTGTVILRATTDDGAVSTGAQTVTVN